MTPDCEEVPGPLSCASDSEDYIRDIDTHCVKDDNSQRNNTEVYLRQHPTVIIGLMRLRLVFLVCQNLSRFRHLSVAAQNPLFLMNLFCFLMFFALINYTHVPLYLYYTYSYCKKLKIPDKGQIYSIIIKVLCFCRDVLDHKCGSPDVREHVGPQQKSHHHDFNCLIKRQK